MVPLDFYIDVKKAWIGLLVLTFLSAAATLILLLVDIPPGMSRAPFWLGPPMLVLSIFGLYQHKHRKPGPTMRFDATGITSSNWKLGPLSWNQIRRVRPGVTKGRQYLVFELTDDVVVPARMKAGMALLGLPPATMWFDAMRPGRDEALHFIKANFPDKAT